MDSAIQAFVQNVITPLIKTMGPNNSKILNLIQNTTPGAESLVTRILTILTDNGNVPASIANVIKKMASEKDLNPRLLIPVLKDFSKVSLTNACYNGGLTGHAKAGYHQSAATDSLAAD